MEENYQVFHEVDKYLQTTFFSSIGDENNGKAIWSMNVFKF